MGAFFSQVHMDQLNLSGLVRIYMNAYGLVLIQITSIELVCVIVRFVIVSICLLLIFNLLAYLINCFTN
jgi:hypothetical protein